jgi:hypothetical protein
MSRQIVCALLAFALVFAAGVRPARATDPAPASLTSWAQACAAISENELTFLSGTPSQCTSSPGLEMTWSDFVGNFQSSGCGSGNPLPTWSQILACAVNGTTVSATTDPWFINGSTYWTVSGGGAFAADSSGLSGEPGGAQAFTSPSGSAGTALAKQQITPITLTVGTTLVARAYLKVASVTSGTTSNGCTQVSATGTATVEILNSSGGVLRAWSTGMSGFTQVATPIITVSSSGTYYVAVSLTTALVTGGTRWNIPEAECIPEPDAYATASAIGVTAANS